MNSNKSSLKYEEIDFRSTPIGDLMLRRRRSPKFGDTDIYEIKLGEDFLMTSLFHEAEKQLAVLGLKATPGDQLDIVVGGLGLGHTAAAALADSRVQSLVVIDYLEAVIRWHQQGLVPLGKALNTDPRCQIIHGDFFALSRNTNEHFNPATPAQLHDAILLDIDHTPTNVLKQTNTRFYTDAGLKEMSSHLKPGGIFALWADGPPEASFTQHLGKIFETAHGHTIEFENPVQGGTSKGAVYVAQKAL